MSYASRKEMGSNRTAAIIIVALIHVALGYALISGLGYNVIKKAAEDLKTFNVDEPPPPPEKPPPPPPKDNTPPPPVTAPPAIVRMAPTQSPIIAPPFIPQPQAPVITPPAPPPPPAPKRIQPAAARGDLHALFSTDDYPASALRNEEQGSTAVRITVGTDGRVADCQVTSSSGSAALDAATCNIIRRRAKYSPARDDTGSPTTGSDSVRIRWVVPKD